MPISRISRKCCNACDLRAYFTKWVISCDFVSKPKISCNIVWTLKKDIVEGWTQHNKIQQNTSLDCSKARLPPTTTQLHFPISQLLCKLERKFKFCAFPCQVLFHSASFFANWILCFTIFHVMMGGRSSFSLSPPPLTRRQPINQILSNWKLWVAASGNLVNEWDVGA